LVSVSVIIPAYQARAFVTRAIDSALGQTATELEILVVDDASCDGTAEFVEARYRRERRLRVIRLARNGGPARARNIGIDHASGEWIAILDADDAWHPDRMQQMLAHTAGIDAVFDNIAGVDAVSGAATGPLFPEFPDGPLTLAALLASRVPGSRFNFGYLKPVIRRRFLDEHAIRYDERLRTSEDLVLYLSLLLEQARTSMLNAPLYIYTKPNSDGQISPWSHTRPRDREVQAALIGLRERYKGRITEEDIALLSHRIDELGRIAPVSDFYHARRTLHYTRMAFLLARHGSVQREVISKLVGRLIR